MLFRSPHFRRPPKGENWTSWRPIFSLRPRRPREKGRNPLSGMGWSPCFDQIAVRKALIARGLFGIPPKQPKTMVSRGSGGVPGAPPDPPVLGVRNPRFGVPLDPLRRVPETLFRTPQKHGFGGAIRTAYARSGHLPGIRIALIVLQSLVCFSSSGFSYHIFSI